MGPPAPTRAYKRREVPAVARAITILRALSKCEEPIGIVPLARQTGMIPGTCLHIVRVLVEEGLVSRDSVLKKYALGAGVLSLANAFLLRNPFVQVVHHHLEELSRDFRAPFAGVEQADRGHLVVVAAADVNPGVSVRITTGSRFPLLMSASGRCVAAFGGLTQPELRKGFARLRWDRPISFETWMSQVARTREQGHAVDHGNYIAGVSIAAVPVLNDKDGLAGCIATVGIKDQMSEAHLQSLISAMRAAAESAGRDLGRTAT